MYRFDHGFRQLEWKFPSAGFPIPYIIAKHKYFMGGRDASVQNGRKGERIKMNLKGRDFLKLLDFTPEEITYMLDLAADLKDKKKKGILTEWHRARMWL